MDNQKCHCGKEGVVFLHYANKSLCERDFIRMFDKRFRKTVRKSSMVKRGDRIAVGLSGGKDSTVLLHSLASLRNKLPFEIVAITIDEGIANYREKTLKFAKEECKKLDVEHVVYSYKKEVGKTLDTIMSERTDDIPCSHCGVMRRYLLNKGAKESGANKLAVGHNLDDIAQTVLMNIMRNEPSRLARLSEPLVQDNKFVSRIKPLMLTPEKEVAIYALLKGLELDGLECPYARFAFRAHVRRMVNETEEKYPGTKFKIVNSFLEMEQALRKHYPHQELASCSSCGEPSSDKICMFCQKVNLVRSKSE